MCGIVGAVAQRDVALILLEGLKRLEYRGYDSAGVAIINHKQAINRVRTLGKVTELESALQKTPISGGCGIAHTRWATHGKPSESNAHPHMSNQGVALVHNGIIENHAELKEKVLALGYQFESETDTEVAAHLFHHYYQQQQDMAAAMKSLLKDLQGAFALGVMCVEEPERLISARKGSPLVVGIGLGENFIASDTLALLPVTQKFIYLEEGDIADVTRHGVIVYDAKGDIIKRNTHTLEVLQDHADKGKYRHFMLKEIFEQTDALSSVLEGRLDEKGVSDHCFGIDTADIFKQVKNIQIIACGTSYHAGLVAKYWFEEFAGIHCHVEVASEFRYRKNVVIEGTLFVTISQSGETADTLAALREARQENYLSYLAICNVPYSSLVRESDIIFMTRAGAEIGVASTKAFTTQLSALLLLAVSIGKHHALTDKQQKSIIEQLYQLPKACAQALLLDKTIEKLAERFNDKNHSLFLGRGSLYPVALEGALKLKEISYIHAEAYPAGELKHGPLALVDTDMPVITIAPNNTLLEKLKSNLQEVQARGGQLIVFADESASLDAGDNVTILNMPTVGSVIAPIVYTIPLQLLSYHVAVLKGTDVDQPRNLAKSVTVE